MIKQRGAALITVMIMMIVVVSILATIFYRHGLSVARATKIVQSEQAAMLALSGENWALEALRFDDDSVDHLNEQWALGLPILPIEGGTLRGELVDLQSRLNINQFGAYASQFTNDNQTTRNSLYRILERLAFLDEQTLLPEHVAALIDWIDPDDNVLAGGAEANEYLLKQPAYRPANSALVDNEELGLVEHFTPALVAALSPYINTVGIGSPVPINVNTAPKRVLMALHADIIEPIADELITMRASQAWTNKLAFYTDLGILLNLSPEATEKQIRGVAPDATISADDFDPIDIKTSYFLLQIAVQLGENIVQLSAIINRNSTGNMIVLARSLRFVPNTLVPVSTE